MIEELEQELQEREGRLEEEREEHYQTKDRLANARGRIEDLEREVRILEETNQKALEKLSYEQGRVSVYEKMFDTAEEEESI